MVGRTVHYHLRLPTASSSSRLAVRSPHPKLQSKNSGKLSAHNGRVITVSGSLYMQGIFLDFWLPIIYTFIRHKGRTLKKKDRQGHKLKYNVQLQANTTND